MILKKYDLIPSSRDDDSEFKFIGTVLYAVTARTRYGTVFGEGILKCPNLPNKNVKYSRDQDSDYVHVRDENDDYLAKFVIVARKEIPSSYVGTFGSAKFKHNGYCLPGKLKLIFSRIKCALLCAREVIGS